MAWLGSAGRSHAGRRQADGAAPLTRWALLPLTAEALAIAEAYWLCGQVCATTATDASVVGSFT